MCKYFVFFVLFATVNLTDLIGGGRGMVGERIDFAQAGEERYGAEYRKDTPPPPCWF